MQSSSSGHWTETYENEDWCAIYTAPFPPPSSPPQHPLLAKRLRVHLHRYLLFSLRQQPVGVVVLNAARVTYCTCQNITLTLLAASSTCSNGAATPQAL